jgi:hypothetical protein
MIELSQIMGAVARRRAEIKGAGRDEIDAALNEGPVATAIQECRDAGFSVCSYDSLVNNNSLLAEDDDKPGPHAATTISIRKGKAEMLVYLISSARHDLIHFLYVPVNAVPGEIDAKKQWDFTQEDVVEGIAAWRDMHSDYFTAIDNHVPLWKRAVELVTR